MSDDDLAALEAEIDAEEARTATKRRSAAPPPANAKRAPPPPPTAASQSRSRPAKPAPASARTAAPASDPALLDDEFNDPYDAIDFKHIAQLTADLRKQAASDDPADADDSDHMAAVSDDAVAADLKAMMAELRAEGLEHDMDDGGVGGEDEDEDDELAQLEKEEAMEEEKQPQQQPTAPPVVSAAQLQTQSRMQAEQIRPAPPVPPVAAPSIDQQLSSLHQQLDSSRRRALDFNRTGKKAEAIEVMRSVKVLEARIRQLETQAQSQPPNLPTTPSQPPSPASRTSSTPALSTTADSSGDALAQLRSRLVDYQRAAVGQKQAGRLDRAQALLLEIRKMKAMVEEAERGARVITASDLPPQPDVFLTQPPRLNRQSSGGTKQASQPTASGSSPTLVAAGPPPPPRPVLVRPAQPSPASPSAATPPPVPPRSPAGSGLTTKQTLQYEHLIATLTAQAKDLQSQVSLLLAEASPTTSAPRSTAAAPSAAATTDRTHKLFALQYHRLVKRTQADIDLLRTALAKHIPPPTYHTAEEKLTTIHEHKDVPDDQLHLHLIAARDLDAATSYAATLQWEGGQVVAYSSGSERGPAPEWKSRWPVVIGARNKATVKTVQRSRVVVVLYRQRLIMGSVEVGRGEMRLKELAGRCDKREWVKVKDGDGKRVGEVCVEVRLRRPLERLDMREETKKLLVIDEFEQDAPAHLQPPPQMPLKSPSSASHASVASASPSSANRSSSPSSPAAPITTPHPTTTTTPAQTRPTPTTTPPTPSPSPPPPTPAPTASPAGHPPLPAGLTATDLSDPHSVLGILSNDVLEWEINTHIPHTLMLARQRQDAAAVEDCMDRLTAAQTQLSILVQAVQAGKLTLEDYLGKLRENIERDSLVARELMRRGKKEDAKLVIQRVQLMRNELKTAEENADELE